MTVGVASLAPEVVLPGIRGLTRVEPREVKGPEPGLWGLVQISAWFGALTGLLELSVVLASVYLLQRVSLDLLRQNHHFLFMIPASNLLIFTTCGLFLHGMGLVWPKQRFRVALWVLGFFAILALLFLVPGLHAVACVLLAAGLSCRLLRWIEPHVRLFVKLARASLPVLALFGAALVGLDRVVVTQRESRSRAALPAAAPGAPNVILIVLDTVRADHLSMYGYSRDTTPHLAQLAQRGVRFERAYSAAPWTLPSHACLFTGRWPHELSVRTNWMLDTKYPTLAGFLARHGYASAGFVANFRNTNAWYGLDQGFARYEDDYRNWEMSLGETLLCSTLGRRMYIAECMRNFVQWAGVKQRDIERKDASMIKRDALDWLIALGRRPFFLFLNYYDAHDPYDPPAGTQSRFARADRRSNLIAWARDGYDNCLAYLDDQLGQLFAELDKRGFLDNTLVIITSDHGEEFGEHQLTGHGSSLYDPELHVPLLLLFPGRVPAGQVASHPVSLRALPATVADLLGLNRESPFPGTSLARFWERPGQQPAPGPEPFLAEVDRAAYLQAEFPDVPAAKGQIWAVFDRSQVYIRYGSGVEELYDLRRDPFELNNLASRPEAQASRARFRELRDGLLRRQPSPARRESALDSTNP